MADRQAVLDPLPTGLVTFCFTDVVGSTALWEHHRDVMVDVITRHDEIIEVLAAEHGGVLLQSQGEGDSTLSVFRRPQDAVAAALAIRRSLADEPWPLPASLEVRAGIHTGDGDIRDGRYFGPALNRGARVRGLAGAGEIYVSGVTAMLLVDVLPPGVTMQDLGLRALKGIDRPERVWAVVEGDSPPATRTAASRPTTGVPPAALSSLVGRAADVADIVRRLAACRLVTITGPGGVGKTRVALEVAADRPAVFADVAPAASAADVAISVATALGADDPAAVPPDEIGPVAGAAALDRGIELLVVDNCEHVVDAVAALAPQLLVAVPSLRILATSQRPLRVEGESVVPLGPLPLTDAVTLFVTRAQSHDPTFDPSGEEQPLAALCERVDCLPLAVELAAAHVRTMTPTEMLGRLGDAMNLLGRGTRRGPERQRTLRAAVDWSVGLLGPTEQRLLERLSVFTGGFTLAAAEAVCSGEGIGREEVAGILADLVDRSFVVRRARGRRTRFWLLETIRQYGLEQLESAARAQPAPVAGAMLSRTGQVWEVRAGGGVVQLPDSKGLRYIEVLVGRAGQEINVVDLVAAAEGHGSISRDGGMELLDTTARSAYRRRLEALAADIERARARGAATRLAELEAEFDAVASELEKATGLGGRSRRAGGTVERARTSVTKAIRSAIAKLEAADESVGRHFDAAISTGTWCAYRP